MCFYHDDYDWVVGRHEVTEGIATVAYVCGECGETIKPGEWYKFHDMYELSDDSVMVDGDGNDLDVTDITDTTEWFDDERNQHTGPGNHDECYVCATCQALLDAIKAVEMAEGCSEYEASPGIGSMYYDVQEGNGWIHYADEYARLNPGGALLNWPIDDDDYIGWLIDHFDGSRKYDDYGQETQEGNFWCDRFGIDSFDMDKDGDFIFPDEGGEG